VADEFVPDTMVCREFGVSRYTLKRWTDNPTLGFPRPIKITSNGRNFRSRRELDAFKQRVMRERITQCGERQ